MHGPSTATMADAMTHAVVHLTKWVNALTCVLIWHEKKNGWFRTTTSKITTH